MKRPLARAFVAAALCAASALIVPPLFSEIPEQRVKAAFIEKFTHFIEWPEDSLGRHGQFVIGVIGYSQVTPHLLEIVSGRRLRDRDLLSDRLAATLELLKRGRLPADRWHLFAPSNHLTPTGEIIR
ncbi:MAG TPA: YfiR family protein, partial [Spirochaetota bacterium]|nr:YfiR family protein [Spirochaetota bacterium]